MSEPGCYSSSESKKLLILYYSLGIITISVFIANLNAITDFYLHPEIPYFDEEHLIVGTVSGVLTAIILIILAISHFKLKINELKINSLNMTLENKVAVRTDELKMKNCELSVIEGILRKQLERNIEDQEQLRQNKLLLKAIIDNSFEFQGLLTPDGKLIESNKTSLDFIGVGKETVLGRYFWDTPWWNHNPSLQDHLREAIRRVAAGELLRFETENQDAGGNIHIIDFSLKPIYNEKDRIIYLMPEGRDITEYRQLENQILQQQKLDSIGLLAGGLAHDFNNLLTPILGYSEMICDKVPSDDPIHQDSALIWDAANCASGLIKQLLSFSRDQDYSRQNHDLNKIVASFDNIMRCTLREEIEIRQNLTVDGCRVLVDRNQIEQILLNLAINSQCAVSGTGTITIETGHLIFDDEFCYIHPGAEPGRYVLLAFSDTGSGIADTDLPHIFEPFFSTSSAGGRGKGLGLFSVYCIVKHHNGFIDVRSKVGQGTTFSIYLPENAVDNGDDEQFVKPVNLHSRQSGVIILVEDNKMVMKMTKNLMEKQGHTVLAFLQPEEALRFVSTHSPSVDLLFSDVVMPVMNGLELYERMEKLIPGLKVLFMSGYNSNTVLHKGKLKEGVNFIQKPFTTETLVKIVGDLIQPDLEVQFPS